MGVFQVGIEVGDPRGERFEKVEALVDSGATYTMLPASLLQRPGVVSIENRTFELADGSDLEMGFGIASVKIEDRIITSPVIFSDNDATALLGAVTPEIFALGIDPVNSRLVPVKSLR